MLRRTLLLLVSMCTACARGESDAEAPAPLGTFCFDVGDSTTCLGPSVFTATRSDAGGEIWFQVAGTLTVLGEDRTVTIMGQVPTDAVFPAEASHVVVSLPLAGACAATHLTSPFGGCQAQAADAVCQAESIYDDLGVAVTVIALSRDAIALRFSGQVQLTRVADCCADDAQCTIAEPARFAPGGPYPVAGEIHAAFSD